MSRYIPPTSDELHAGREETGEGLMSIKRRLVKDRLLDALQDTDLTVEDLREMLIIIVEKVM